MAYKDMTPQQLRALADQKERGTKPNVANLQQVKQQKPKKTKIHTATEVKVGDKEFHVTPGLEDNWDFQIIYAELQEASTTNDVTQIVAAVKKVITYMFDEPYDTIMDTLRTLHPEDKHPHVHIQDMLQLIQDGSPKAS